MSAHFKCLKKKTLILTITFRRYKMGRKNRLMESYYISEDRDFLQAMEQAYLRQLGFAEGFLETFPKEFSEKSRTSLEYAKRFAIFKLIEKGICPEILEKTSGFNQNKIEEIKQEFENK